ncbi:hypothetical protein FSP39_010984 [Pinctada imbricata]|uniref:F5/8 type C domain-containing protein n=1 Tax=Pinctada imbricata TaxID=66713 RepID=A0AA88XWB8_PINIB|nr:hypothetical protein FSP39_010984 [Pinctada imbricata]
MITCIYIFIITIITIYIFMIIIMIIYFFFTEPLRNLALHKPANQSSTHSDVASYGAFRAVDGIRQAYWVPPYCTHTTDEHNPFWYVDLGEQHEISRVEIVNRAGYGERLRDISVVVAENQGKYDQTCGHYKGPGKKVPMVKMTCPERTRGRYVKVQVATAHKLPLTLCEVEVWGY